MLELVIVMLPALLVMLIPEPAVSVESAYPVPLPINSWPLVGVVDRPVPPEATGNGDEKTGALVSVTLAAELI